MAYNLETHIPSNSTIIVGLSGGPDSVFLLHQLNTLKTERTLTLIAAHLNHGWRQEAAHDEAFCRALAHQLNIPFIAAHASAFPAVQQNGSQEAYGRDLRRAFFAQLVQQHQTEHVNALVALAHHRDDQVETFFIRLMRGAGLAGLCGMRTQHGFYIRPLLHIAKSEILEYLHAHNIPSCIDHTNEHDTYLRNRIRNHALPALTQCDARFTQSVVRTMQHFEQIDDFVQHEVIKHFAEISEMHNDKRWISLEKLFTLHPFMQQQILLHWLCIEQLPFTPSQTFFEEIFRFLRQPAGGTHTLYNSWCVIKKQSHAQLQKL